MGPLRHGRRQVRPLLYVCAPWRERTPESLKETRAAISKAVALGWAPIFGPFLLPDLDDADEAQRETAFQCDLAILARCQGILVVGERMTPGMKREEAAWLNHAPSRAHLVWTPNTIGSPNGR